MRDKKVFLLDKEHYTKEQVENLTEDDLENWVAEDGYEDNYAIIKIDGNGCKSPIDAIVGEGYDTTEFEEDYHLLSFGFDEKRYEIYDINDEVIDKVNDINEALGCAEAQEAKFVLDIETNEIVFGSTD